MLPVLQKPSTLNEFEMAETVPAVAIPVMPNCPRSTMMFANDATPVESVV
jgi:hypothetical protein